LKGTIINIGTVVGNTSPQEYKFHLRSFAAKLGDLVTVEIEIPSDDPVRKRDKVIVWGRITGLQRFNPFLPAEAGSELADEGLDLLDTVLSSSRDQIEGTVLVLGRTSHGDYKRLTPLNYPVQPGAVVQLPPESAVKTILTGDDTKVHRLRLGTLIGRRAVDVSLKTNTIIARHMAILAMTGGGKTVAARRIIRELLEVEYPLVILDPHGDYLGFWEKSKMFPKNKIRLFYPHLNVCEENRDVISFLVSRMTQGFSEPQAEKYERAKENIKLRDTQTIDIRVFIDKLLQEVDSLDGGKPSPTKSVIKRQLRLVNGKMMNMFKSNEALREKLKELPFEPMPDPVTSPHEFVNCGQASILYLGGYDHLTQSTIVSLVLKHLFEHRATMSNIIPPFITVVEEAHNFIPSRGEGQAETPSVEIMRKIITEGRKFGTGLLLISQRPSRLDETTLSQCNTFLIFRLVNPRDQTFVEKVMENLSKADSKLLPGFGPGQGIISGQAVRFPLLVKVDFDDELVAKSLGDEDYLVAAKNWKISPEAEALVRGLSLEDDLKKADNV